MAKSADAPDKAPPERPDKTAPNPAGHLRGNQRPEGMTDEEWEAERKRVNEERQAERHEEAPPPAPPEGAAVNPPPVDPENPVGQGAQDLGGAPPPPPDPLASEA